MEINKEIRSKEKEVNTYIEELEEWILGLKASKFFDLVMALDDASGKIAQDVRILVDYSLTDEEADEKLVIIGSKSNKRYEQILGTLKQLKDFKLVNDLLQEMKPKTVLKEVKKGNKTVFEEEAPPPPPRMQDLVMKKNGN